MMKKKIGFMTLVLSLAVCAGTVRAQNSDWPSWNEGRDAKRQAQWEEMGAWYTEAMNALSGVDKIQADYSGLSDKYRTRMERNFSLLSREASGLRDLASGLRDNFSTQKKGADYWSKNKARYQGSLARLTESKQKVETALAAASAEQRANEYLAAGDKYLDQKQYEEALAEYHKSLAELDKLSPITAGDTRRRVERGIERAESATAKAAAEKKAAEERQAAIAAANAKGVTAADFEYDITRDGKGIVIKKYKGLATVVNIPAAIESFPVREIDGAFRGNIEITSVTIPNSVTISVKGGIGGEEIRGAASAFSDCTSLTTVTLPRNLKAIPDGMFSGCTSLTSIAIPNTVTKIGVSAFDRCTSLSTITLPSGLSSIGRSAFYGCSRLASVTLPDSLTTMGGHAFAGSGLTSVVLPKNLKDLNYMSGGSFADGIFKDCSKLENVTIESSGLRLSNTFSNCNALTTLTINGNIVIVDNGRGGTAFDQCDNLTTVNIGPKVTKIGNVDILINAGKLSIATKAALAKFR